MPRKIVMHAIISIVLTAFMIEAQHVSINIGWLLTYFQKCVSYRVYVIFGSWMKCFYCENGKLMFCFNTTERVKQFSIMVQGTNL